MGQSDNTERTQIYRPNTKMIANPVHSGSHGATLFWLKASCYYLVQSTKQNKNFSQMTASALIQKYCLITLTCLKMYISECSRAPGMLVSLQRGSADVLRQRRLRMWLTQCVNTARWYRNFKEWGHRLSLKLSTLNDQLWCNHMPYRIHFSSWLTSWRRKHHVINTENIKVSPLVTPAPVTSECTADCNCMKAYHSIV